jgi:hypothetical protein
VIHLRPAFGSILFNLGQAFRTGMDCRFLFFSLRKYPSFFNETAMTNPSGDRRKERRHPSIFKENLVGKIQEVHRISIPQSKLLTFSGGFYE